MSDAISRFDAQKLVYDYCHARTVEGRQLKSPAVFTTHTGTDLAEAIGALPALPALPAAQPAREQVAFSMWKAEADRAAPNVGKNRIPSGFMVASDADREKWLGLADAAILAMMGESHE